MTTQEQPLPQHLLHYHMYAMHPYFFISLCSNAMAKKKTRKVLTFLVLWTLKT